MSENSWLQEEPEQPVQKRGRNTKSSPPQSDKKGEEKNVLKEAQCQKDQLNEDSWNVDLKDSGNDHTQKEIKLPQAISFLEEVGEQLKVDPLENSWVQQEENKIPQKSRRGTQPSKRVQQNNKVEEEEQQEQKPKRGNRQRTNIQDSQPMNFKKKQPYEDNNQGGYRGGNRQDKGRGGYNNYNNRDYNSDNRGYNNNRRGQGRGGYGNYNNRGRQQNEQSSYRPKNFYEGQGRRNNYNYNSTYNNNNYEQRKKPIYQSKNQYDQKIQQNQKQEIKSHKQEVKSKDIALPNGRRSWPQMSIYIYHCKVSLTLRQLYEISATILVIPYQTTLMQYWPGNIINTCNSDYRAKLLSKGQTITGAGYQYLCKVVSDKVKNYLGFSFMKVDANNVGESVRKGVLNIIKNAQKTIQPKISSVVFPISKKLGHINTVIQNFVQGLQAGKSLKEVYICTNDQQCFLQGIESFQELMKEMVDKNQMCIDF